MAVLHRHQTRFNDATGSSRGIYHRCRLPRMISRDDVDALPYLERLSQLLEETEHLRRWPQEKVAKIVQ